MGDSSAIEWTSATWNPLVGCTRVSEGCRHCYAERTAYRLEAMGQHAYQGITKKVGGEIRWTGKVNLVPSSLTLPLTWKKPRRIFVNSMSDLFHEDVGDLWIDSIFRVMMSAPQHTYQILTKRPERMLAYLKDQGLGWPWAHVWLGVSVEDQATADARIPLLLQTPAAVRWVSYEPALGPVDFDGDPYSGPGWLRGWYTEPEHWRGCDGSCSAGRCPEPIQVENEHRLDWLVIGGESGPGARPFDLAWARQTIAQGRKAGVPVFVKQMGANPVSIHTITGSPRVVYHPLLKDRKGGTMAEWPDDLRVREYPEKG